MAIFEYHYAKMTVLTIISKKLYLNFKVLKFWNLRFEGIYFQKYILKFNFKEIIFCIIVFIVCEIYKSKCKIFVRYKIVETKMINKEIKNLIKKTQKNLNTSKIFYLKITKKLYR